MVEYESMPGYWYDDEEDEIPEIGTCQGCGAYGYLGRTHNRKIDGILEECGEYL